MIAFWKRFVGFKPVEVPPFDQTRSGGLEMLRPLDLVLGELLETWGQRYEFTFDREDWKITFRLAGFKLLATETAQGNIRVEFQEAGTKHRVECPVAEAPKMIETLLFPPP